VEGLAKVAAWEQGELDARWMPLLEQQDKMMMMTIYKENTHKTMHTDLLN